MIPSHSAHTDPAKLIVGASIACLALFLGYLLVSDMLFAALGLMALGWVFTLQYHGSIGTALSIALAQSALIVPFLPGPIYVAEMGALMAISAVPIAIVWRRYPEDTNALFWRNVFVFLGMAIFGLTLLFIAKYRGVSVGMLGGGQGGAKIYFQQFVYILIPILFLFVGVSRDVFLKLVALYFIMPATFLISDIAVAIAPGAARWVVAFITLPVDSMLFNETASSMSYRFGFRRLQSLYLVCPNLIFLIFVLFSAKTVLGRRAAVLIPSILFLLILGLASGHRATLIHTGVVLFVIAIVQGVFNARNLILFFLAGLLAIVIMFATVSYWPASMQRAVSFVPGLGIESAVAYDANETWRGRIEVSKRGLELIPDYLWVGRGFTRYTDIIAYSLEHVDSIERSVLQGHFLNGFVGAMVNTGILGTIGISMFILGGCALSVRVIRRCRILGFENPIVRVGGVIGSLLLVNAFFFYFVEGNVEGALRRFGIQIGMLFVCERLLARELGRRTSGEDAPQPTREEGKQNRTLRRVQGGKSVIFE